MMYALARKGEKGIIQHLYRNEQTEKKKQKDR